MPISHHLKAIFIHIPKNAGESIEKAMGMYGGLPAETLWGRVENRFVLQHLTATELQDSGLVTQEIWRQYFKFAVVRNPWSKAVSEYNWYLRYGPSVSFNEWLDSVEHRIKINQSIHMKEIGHPIINDIKYGGKKVANKKPSPRLCLHAYQITIKKYLKNQKLTITCPNPDFVTNLS